MRLRFEVRCSPLASACRRLCGGGSSSRVRFVASAGSVGSRGRFGCRCALLAPAGVGAPPAKGWAGVAGKGAWKVEGQVEVAVAEEAAVGWKPKLNPLCMGGRAVDCCCCCCCGWVARLDGNIVGGHCCCGWKAAGCVGWKAANECACCMARREYACRLGLAEWLDGSSSSSTRGSDP